MLKRGFKLWLIISIIYVGCSIGVFIFTATCNSEFCRATILIPGLPWSYCYLFIFDMFSINNFTLPVLIIMLVPCIVLNVICLNQWMNP